MAGSRNKSLFLIIENYISQEISIVLCMGRWKFWAHWNHSFDVHLSYLGPISCVFTSWVFHREWLQSDGCYIAGIFFFPSQFPSGSMAHAWKWLQSRMTVTYFVYWFGRQYFISLMGEFEGTLMYLNGLYIKWSWNWNTSDLNPAQIQCGTWSHRFFWFVCFVLFFFF